MTTVANRVVNLTPLILKNPFDGVVMPERMAWTASSLRLFRKCRRKFFWKYIMRLRTKYRASALMIGAAFHDTLGIWYKGSRIDMGKIADQRAKQLDAEASKNSQYFDQDDYDKLTTMIETFGGMLRGYAAVYSKDRNDWNIERKSIEQKFSIDMGDFDFMGKIDLVFARKTNAKTRTICEHKTTSQIRGSYIDRLPLDTQIRGYTFGAKRGLGYPITEVLYDVVKKCKLRRKSNESISGFCLRIAQDYIDRPEFYFYREPLLFGKNDLDSFEYELRQTHNEYKWIIKGKHWGDLVGVETGEPEDPRSWAPNDATCDEYFRTCDYHKLCTTGLDRGTGISYKQGDHMHEELVEDEE